MRRLLAALLLCLAAVSAASAQSIQLQVPARGLRMPSGELTVNWANPLTQGLSLAYPFSYYPAGALYSARGQTPLLLVNGGWISPTAAGPALTADNNVIGGGVYSHNATTYTIPTTQGSMFAFVRAGWTPADSVWHTLLQSSTNGSVPAFQFEKFTDNMWQFGWNLDNGAGDHRVIVSATGTFTAGDAFVVGGTWSNSATTLYVKGVSIGTNAAAPSTFSTSGLDLCIGCWWNGSAVGNGWSSASMVDGVYYLAIWDRVLSAGEIASLSQNPSQIFLTMNDAVMATLVGLAAPPAAHSLFMPSVPW